MSATEADRKYSVYIALVIAGAVTMYELASVGTVSQTQDIALAFLAFAGARQAIKSFLKK